MENLRIEQFISFVEAHRYLGYAVLYFAMVIEGEVFLIVAGILARLKAFDIGDAFFIALSGVLTGDCLWYYFGSALKGKSFATRLIAQAKKTVMFLLPHFSNKPFKSIFLSKFIYGANHATLVVSGALGIVFRTFIKAELVASSSWTIFFLSVGFFFGNTAIQMTHKASRFILLTVIFVVAFVSLQRFFASRYEKNNNSQR